MGRGWLAGRLERVAGLAARQQQRAHTDDTRTRPIWCLYGLYILCMSSPYLLRGFRGFPTLLLPIPLWANRPSRCRHGPTRGVLPLAIKWLSEMAAIANRLRPSVIGLGLGPFSTRESCVPFSARYSIFRYYGDHEIRDGSFAETTTDWTLVLRVVRDTDCGVGAGCAHSDKHKADELPARVTGFPHRRRRPS